ncbi:SET domain-containing protein [Desulfobotulus mexicanus]|uniref:SET domain-containing protein n=1 Tax=Desulfobotulus mexicanus TaxID=2586642 RepID=A0A5S5MDI3_9BACT|nr:SET domain-containing protein [Desulfobotulus mexicanus]TYT73767.1 SET domain-containing protein [Desulfobotulus mexicanus]
MLHPHTEVRFISEEIGRGVFATRPIPKGTVVWVQDRFDRVFTEAEVRSLEPVYQEILETYCFRDRCGRWIFCWDNTRYVNHSFSPTCILTPYGFELAVQDIEVGQQITNDYGFFNIIEPFDCLPEEGCQRSRVLPDDILRFAEIWDTRLAEAFTFFNRVAQPLSGLISKENHDIALAIAKGERSADSIRCCYFAGENACCHA